MSLGPLMVDLAGTQLCVEEKELLGHPAVGGVILFTRNFESVEQIAALIDSIHRLREPRLLIGVDQEGGRVQRFRDGFTRLPALRGLGTLYDDDRKRARHYAQLSAWLMAGELRAVGVDLSFGPVLDLDRGLSSVIGDRALHGRPEAVADLAHAYMLGMREAGMEATGKHFPGHGAVAADSHLALPVDERSYADLAIEDLLPFERMIHYGLAAVMMAHVVYPRVDPRPAGFATAWVQDVLRNEFNFQGAVFSDDLSMVAAGWAGDPQARVEAALQAGCDMALLCNDPAARDRVVESLSVDDDPVRQLRLTRLHGRHEPSLEAVRKDVRWREAREALRAYDPEPLLDMDM